jgi:DNA-binding MarR family transcriptional regulator
MEETRNKLTTALLGIYKLKAVSTLSQFLQGELSLLFALSKLSPQVSPTEAVAKLNFTKARMTKIMYSLKSKKLITISKNSVDKRKLDITLTPKGYEIVKSKEEEALKIFYYLVDKLGSDDTNIFIDELEKITKIMEEFDE